MESNRLIAATRMPKQKCLKIIKKLIGESKLIGVSRVLVNHQAIIREDERGQRVVSAFREAASRNYVDVLKILKNEGAEVDLRDNDENTAFHYAAYNKANDALIYLKEIGASIDAVNNMGHTALFTAASLRYFGTIKILVNLGASVDSKDNHGMPILCTLLVRPDFDQSLTESLEFLLRHGARPNVADDNGRTPLMVSSLNGMLGPVVKLLDHGADPDLVDGEGQTALHFAALNSRIDVVKKLVERGANIFIKSSAGSAMAYALASKSSARMEVYDYLIEKTADFHVLGVSRNTERRCAVCANKSCSLCRGCRLTRYCSTECQSKHWEDHRVKCIELRKQRKKFLSAPCAATIARVRGDVART